jgi:hypothetical protein
MHLVDDPLTLSMEWTCSSKRYIKSQPDQITGQQEIINTQSRRDCYVRLQRCWLLRISTGRAATSVNSVVDCYVCNSAVSLDSAVDCYVCRQYGLLRPSTLSTVLTATLDIYIYIYIYRYIYIYIYDICICIKLRHDPSRYITHLLNRCLLCKYNSLIYLTAQIQTTIRTTKPTNLPHWEEQIEEYLDVSVHP